MLKLPNCPHCNTVYHYKDVKNAINNKNNVCYNCKKSFRARLFPKALALVVFIAAVCIILNILMLNKMTEFNFFVLFTVTLIFIAAAYFLLPYFASFKKVHDNNKN